MLLCGRCCYMKEAASVLLENYRPLISNGVSCLQLPVRLCCSRQTFLVVTCDLRSAYLLEYHPQSLDTSSRAGNDLRTRTNLPGLVNHPENQAFFSKVVITYWCLYDRFLIRSWCILCKFRAKLFCSANLKYAHHRSLGVLWWICWSKLAL